MPFSRPATMTDREQNIQDEFMAMLRRCQGTLVKVCLTFGGSNAEDQRDLYQEIVCELWASWPSFRHESQASTWATGVALNVGSKRSRRHRRRPEIVTMEESFFDSLADEAGDERYQRLYQLVELLGATERRLLYLYLDRMPLRDIARMENLSTAAVKLRILRIKKKLKLLKEQQYEE